MLNVDAISCRVFGLICFISLLGQPLGVVQPAFATQSEKASSELAKLSLPAVRIVGRTISSEQPGFYNAVYVGQSGFHLRSGYQISADNGRSWKKSPVMPDFDTGLPYGYRRNETTYLFDPATQSLLTIVNALDTPGLDPNAIEPSISLETYYLRYRVSADGGRTWLFDKPIVQTGNYTQLHPFNTVWIGTNSIFLGDLGCIPLATRTGHILVPAQITVVGPDGELWNPMGVTTYTEVLILRGSWTTNHHLNWTASPPVRGDLNRTSRGVIEPTLAEFSDSRILMVMRGSNGGKSDPEFKLPSYRWFSTSRDDGQTWSTPKPWTYDDGQPFFSPSAMSTLFRHSSGRCFWIGNLTPMNCHGNLPRWPVVVGAVSPKSLTLIRDSVVVVDTEQPDDKTQGRLDLSHFSVIEDRETKEIVLVYPRSHNAYKSREWATVRLAVR